MSQQKTYTQKQWQHTQYASYFGYITQAIVNNFAPLLFLIFQDVYEIPLEQITLLVTVNFCLQLQGWWGLESSQGSCHRPFGDCSAQCCSTPLVVA